jgi:hypothetical protein
MIEKLRCAPSRTNKTTGLGATVSFVVGGVLLIWSGYIHFHLWQKLGYRHIPTIGPLFLLQSIAGLLTGVLLIAVRRVWIALAGAGFAASTMVGFFISVEHGLFGFKDSWSAPFAHQAFAIEVATIAVTIVAGALCLTGSASATRAGHLPAGIVS